MKQPNASHRAAYMLAALTVAALLVVGYGLSRLLPRVEERRILSASEAKFEEVAQAVVDYRRKHGSYPPSVAALLADDPAVARIAGLREESIRFVKPGDQLGPDAYLYVPARIHWGSEWDENAAFYLLQFGATNDRHCGVNYDFDADGQRDTVTRMTGGIVCYLAKPGPCGSDEELLDAMERQGLLTAESASRQRIFAAAEPGP